MHYTSLDDRAQKAASPVARQDAWVYCWCLKQMLPPDAPRACGEDAFECALVPRGYRFGVLNPAHMCDGVPGEVDSSRYRAHLPLRSMGHSPEVEQEDWLARKLSVARQRCYGRLDFE